MLGEYNEMKKEIKNPKIWKHILSDVIKCQSGEWKIKCKKTKKKKKHRLMLLSNCAVCGIKNSRSIKNQEPRYVVFNNSNNI